MNPSSLGEKTGKSWSCVDKGGERKGGDCQVFAPKLQAGAAWWTTGPPPGKPEQLEITRLALNVLYWMHGGSRGGWVGS